MSSALTGLIKTLTWNDFRKLPKPQPGPGQTGTAAHTSTTANMVFGFSSSGKAVELADNVQIAIKLVPSETWVADWVFTRSQQFQDDLLKHEQGHYDITALLARDKFIEIMALKGQSFANRTALDTAIGAIVTTHETQPVHDKYDAKAESDHGMNAMQQTAWDKIFNTARTTPRSPAVTAPNGVAYKVTLLELLKKAGKSP